MSPRSDLHPDFGPSFGDEAVPYGIPITVVDRDTRRVRLRFTYASESDRVRYPIGDGTRIEGGRRSDGDRHAIPLHHRRHRPLSPLACPPRRRVGVEPLASTDGRPVPAAYRLLAGRLSARHQTVLRAMKRYGLVLADNGSLWFIQGEAARRWPTGLLDELKTVPARAFEAVDTQLLMVDPDSGRAHD